MVHLITAIFHSDLTKGRVKPTCKTENIREITRDTQELWVKVGYVGRQLLYGVSSGIDRDHDNIGRRRLSALEAAFQFGQKRQRCRTNVRAVSETKKQQRPIAFETLICEFVSFVVSKYKLTWVSRRFKNKQSVGPHLRDRHDARLLNAMYKACHNDGDTQKDGNNRQGNPMLLSKGHTDVPNIQ